MSKLSLGFDGRSLRARLAMTMVAVAFFAIAAMAGVGSFRISQKIQEDIETRTLWSIRIAARILSETTSVMSIQNNADGEPEKLRVFLSTMVIDNFAAAELNKIVDSIADTNRGNVTFLRWKDDKQDFVRVATTLKGSDGKHATGTTLGQDNPVYPILMKGQAYRGPATVLGEVQQVGYLPVIGNDGKTVAVLYVGVGKLSELASASSAFMRDLLIASAIILVLAAVVTLVATDRLLRPLGRVAEATSALAGGADAEIPHRDRSDQIGQIARAVESFREAVHLQRLGEATKADEARKLAARKAEMDHMVVEFRENVGRYLDQLRAGAGQVRATSGEIRAAVKHAGQRVVEGRDAADSGANAISEVATATNQFASSITEIAARSNEAANIVRKASESGKRAEHVSAELAGVVEKISTAVSVISSIASQTNLLALNATIEAARAGEAGKGFAVVASEVKELSNGTSRAATEIADLVKSIEGVTEAVTGATRDIGAGLESINETTLVIASAVTEQEQVTRDIAANADNAAQRSDIIRSGFGDVEKAIQNTDSATDSLDALSQDFASSADVLVREIEGFLDRMAA